MPGTGPSSWGSAVDVAAATGDAVGPAVDGAGDEANDRAASEDTRHTNNATTKNVFTNAALGLAKR